MTYPQRFTILRESDAPPTYDEGTGNEIPRPRIEREWTGLLQQRFLDTQQTPVTGIATSNELVLQLDPGLPGGLQESDRVRFDSDTRLGVGEGTSLVQPGDVLTIRGVPHVRRPAMGGPAQYIVATVRRATDLNLR